MSQREAQEARALTCGMIAMVDDAVGQIRQAAVDANLLRTQCRYTPQITAITSANTVFCSKAEQYDSLTHVPFIWADPKGPDGVRSSELAQTHDIGSTILEHARIEGAIGMQGQVMSVAGGEGRDAAHIQYETQRTQEAFGERPRVHTIIHRQWRLSMYVGKCQNEHLISKMIRGDDEPLG